MLWPPLLANAKRVRVRMRGVCGDQQPGNSFARAFTMGYECFTLDGFDYPVTKAPGNETCQTEANQLNRLIEVCTGRPGTLACTYVAEHGVHAIAASSYEECKADAEGLASIVLEHNGFAANIGCSRGGFLRSEKGCPASMTAVNSAVVSYETGSFGQCQRTTPTT